MRLRRCTLSQLFVHHLPVWMYVRWVFKLLLSVNGADSELTMRSALFLGNAESRIYIHSCYMLYIFVSERYVLWILTVLCAIDWRSSQIQLLPRPVYTSSTAGQSFCLHWSCACHLCLLAQASCVWSTFCSLRFDMADASIQQRLWYVTRRALITSHILTCQHLCSICEYPLKCFPATDYSWYDRSERLHHDTHCLHAAKY